MAHPRHLLPLLCLSTCLLLAVPPAAAHEQFTAGAYTLEVGWLYEPPMADQPNSVTVSIHQGNATGAAISDGVQLVPTIQLGSDSKALPLEGSDENPGFFTASFVPTQAGSYTVHLTGTVKGAAIDHTTKLQGVESAAENGFPTMHGTIAGLEAKLATLQLTTWALGGVALLFALMALIVASRTRRPVPTSTPARPSMPPGVILPAPPQPRANRAPAPRPPGPAAPRSRP
jgi:hypothetical protein